MKKIILLLITMIFMLYGCGETQQAQPSGNNQDISGNGDNTGDSGNTGDGGNTDIVGNSNFIKNSRTDLQHRKW